MPSILVAVAGSTRTMLAASWSVIVPTGWGGTSVNALFEADASVAPVGVSVLTFSLLSGLTVGLGLQQRFCDRKCSTASPVLYPPSSPANAQT